MRLLLLLIHNLLFCPEGPEQHSNLDVPPKLFLMVIIKDLAVSFSQSCSHLKFFCGPITQVKRGALVLTSVEPQGPGLGRGVEGTARSSE